MRVIDSLLRQSAERIDAFARDAFKVGVTLYDAGGESGGCRACVLPPEGNGAAEACRGFSRTLLTAAQPLRRCPRGLHVVTRPIVLSESDQRLLVSHGFLAESSGGPPQTEEALRRASRDLPHLGTDQVRLLEGYCTMAADLLASLARTATHGPALENVREEFWREEFGAPSIVGVSPTVSAVREALPSLANSRETLFLDAEPGCGRHLIAGTIHRLSPRRSHAFIAENVAAIPEALQESELFGHGDSAGLLETAAGGTLLLHGIEHLTVGCQKRLAEFLTGGPAGSRRRKDPLADVRIISTADGSLDEAVRKGRFRSDLVRKLSVLTLDISPLRERPEDIPPLAEHLLRRRAAALGTAIPLVDPEAMEALKKYSWPGNVRELGEELAQAAAGTSVIRIEDLEGRIVRASRAQKTVQSDLRQAVGEVESELITRTLADTNWNKSRAARLLGLSRLGLQKKIDRYDLDRRR